MGPKRNNKITMKGYYRHILIVSAVILAAAACNKNEPDSPQDNNKFICISATEGVTKALLDKGSFNTTGNRIQVYDFVTDGTTTSKHIDAYAGPDVDSSSPMHTDGYTWPFEDKETSAPITYQWIPGTHKFFGWLAKDANFGATPMTPETFFGAEFQFNEETQTLTIPAKTIDHTTPQFDFLYSNVVTTEPQNDPVNMEFGHLFTAVSFGAQNRYNTDVTIHEFRVERILNTRSAEIAYDVDGKQPVVTYADGNSFLTISTDKEFVLQSKASVSNIFNGDDNQKFIMLWPLGSSHIHSEVEPDEDGQMVADYRMYIRYSSGSVQNAERRINFPDMNWEAGRMYHFDIVFADKIVKLDFNVNPWDYVQQQIDFSEGTIYANQQLVWDPTSYVSTDDDKKAFFYPDQRPIKGSFILGTPVGGTWMVSLVGDIDAFEIIPDNGIIDGKEAKFVVRSKVDDPKREYQAKLKFAVRRSDGTVVSADVVLMDIDKDGDITDDQYTIILSRN